MEWSKKQIGDWREVHKKKKGPHVMATNNQHEEARRGLPLATGELKINFDASVIEGALSFSWYELSEITKVSLLKEIT